MGSEVAHLSTTHNWIHCNIPSSQYITTATILASPHILRKGLFKNSCLVSETGI